MSLSYYLAALALAATLIVSASVVSEGERALSRMETPEEKTDLLVKEWLERLSLGYYEGATEKARERARLAATAGYHRERVLASGLGLGVLSAAFLAFVGFGPPARGRGARRRLATHLQGVAAICLLVGLVAPMLTVIAHREVAVLGSVVLQFETKSILGTVRDLFARGSAFVAVLLFTFSVLVPVAKLVLSLAALLAVPGRARDAFVRIVHAIAKWSMTDVFVVAVLLAFLATGDGELTDAHLGPGLYFFAAYALLSFAGGMTLARSTSGSGDGSRGAPPG